MLVDLDMIKAWLKITATTYDDALTALEGRASAIVQRELRWYFGPSREKVETLNGTGTNRMYLHQPAIDLAVALESRTGPGDDWTAVEATDYELDGRGLYVLAGYRWAKGFRNFRATYNEGFTEAPEDIQQVVLDLVAAIWNRRTHEGFSSESISDYSYSVEDLGNLPRWTLVVNTWRRGRI